MTLQAETPDEFARLHRLFVFHLGVAVTLAWMTALFAALHAPWVRDIRALIDPAHLAAAESTSSFLFGLPVLLTAGWVSVALGANVLRRFQTLKSHAAEFGCAGVAAFVVFYMAIDRAVTAFLLGAT